MIIKTKLDALQATQDIYFRLLAKPNALAADIKTAKDNYEHAQDIYSLDLGMNN